MITTTHTHRQLLWKVAQIQSSNIFKYIKNNDVGSSFNKALSEKALALFKKFVGKEQHVDHIDSQDDIVSQRGKRRRRSNTHSSVTSSTLMSKYTVHPKTGLTTNDHFFEYQRNHGYCQQLMPTVEYLQLEKVIISEIQSYLLSFHTLAAKNIADRLENDPTIRLDTWATVQIGNEAYHADHVHNDVFVSGVYYSAIPEGSAPLVFHKSNEPINKKDESHVILPEEAQIVIFPPWLLHGVPRGNNFHFNDQPRVSFAFNLSGYALSDPWDVTKINTS